MKKRVILKTGIEILVTVGVGIILDAAIERVLPADIGRVKKTLAKIGGAAIIGAVAHEATKQMNGYVDDFINGMETGRKLRDQLLEPKSDLDDKTAEEMRRYMEQDVVGTAAVYGIDLTPENEEDSKDGV